MPKKDKKPITSVIVVTKTLDAKAGSIFNLTKNTTQYLKKIKNQLRQLSLLQKHSMLKLGLH